jgi:hypothetical protein
MTFLHVRHRYVKRPTSAKERLVKEGTNRDTLGIVASFELQKMTEMNARFLVSIVLVMWITGSYSCIRLSQYSLSE